MFMNFSSFEQKKRELEIHEIAEVIVEKMRLKHCCKEEGKQRSKIKITL